MLIWIQKGDLHVKGTLVDGVQYDLDHKQLNGPRVERSEQVVSDMAELQVLNDPQLLYNVSERYRMDKLFTYVGPTLLVVNPFKKVPEIEQQRYIKDIILDGKEFKSLSPHAYAVAAQAFKQVERKNQAIVISGESGAGKTENARSCMNLITGINSVGDTLCEKILSCNPILESFGNAKTARNNNSSRFGKYSRLLVKNNKIIGAEIVNYLLEKSRVITQGPLDDNFHIFYLILQGCTQQQLAEIQLTQSSYKYLAKGLKPISEFQELITAFQTVGINQMDVFKVVAAVLLIGNLEFDESTLDNNNPCNIINQDLLKSICSLLYVNPDLIRVALTHKVTIIGKERILSPLKLVDCMTVRDSWAKELYAQLFQYLIDQLNKTLMIEQSDQYIGLLDIYGFEVFDTGNGFEQILINYTNEKLHQLYIEYVFKEEKRQFEIEGLGEYTDRIKFSDNTAVIELFDTKVCIFSLVDEACKLNSTDAKLLQSLRKELKFASTVKPTFKIIHTAKDVEYTCTQFVDKNKDEIPPLLLEAKYDKVIQFQAKPKSICSKIKLEIAQLMSELNKCDVHFIRCIKPNDDKKPNALNQLYALQQIRYLGVLDSLKVRKESYPIRFKYKQFYDRYGAITNNPLQQPDADFKRLVQEMLVSHIKDTDQHLFGNTQIFIQDLLMKKIEKFFQDFMRVKIMNAIKIQRRYRAMKLRQNYKRFMKRIHQVKAALMHFRLRIILRKRIKAALVIHKFYKQYLINKKQKLYKNQIKYIKEILFMRRDQRKIRQIVASAVKIQRSYKVIRLKREIRRRSIIRIAIRRIFEQTWLNIRHRAALKIQKRYRGYRCRKQYYKEVLQIQDVGRQIRIRKKVTMLQKWTRGFLTRLRLEKMHNAASLIQGYFKMKNLSEIFQRMRIAAVHIQRRFRETIPARRLLRENYQKYIVPMEEQLNRQKQIEFSDLTGYRFNGTDYDEVLHGGPDQVTPKMYLFSFIIDLEILSDTSEIFIDSFANNYKDLFIAQFSQFAIQFISVGDTNGYAISNKLYGWGLNDACQLCQPEDGNIHGPTAINIPGRAKQIVSGSSYTLLLMEDSRLYLWGTYKGRSVDHAILMAKEAEHVDAFRNDLYWIAGGKVIHNMKPVFLKVRASKVSCGLNFCIVLGEGQIFSNGTNEHGQLGLGDKLKREQLTQIHISEKIVDIDCGVKHSACLSVQGRLYTWGFGKQGQLGIDLQDQLMPLLSLNNVSSFVCGSRCTVSLCGQKVIQCGTNGQIQNSAWTQMEIRNKTLLKRDYHIVRLISTYSSTLSVISAIYACSKGVFKNNPAKASKVTQLLTSKWNGVHSIDPPLVDSLANYLSEKHQRRSNMRVQSSPQSAQIQLRLKLLQTIPYEEWTQEDKMFISIL